MQALSSLPLIGRDAWLIAVVPAQNSRKPALVPFSTTGLKLTPRPAPVAVNPWMANTVIGPTVLEPLLRMGPLGWAPKGVVAAIQPNASPPAMALASVRPSPLALPMTLHMRCHDP